MQSSLPAGWLAFTGRELNPLDRYKRFQIIHPPFLDLAWRKGSFIGGFLISRSAHSITSSAATSKPGWNGEIECLRRSQIEGSFELFVGP